MAISDWAVPTISAWWFLQAILKQCTFLAFFSSHFEPSSSYPQLYYEKKCLRESERAVWERRFRGSAALLVVLSTFWNHIVYHIRQHVDYRQPKNVFFLHFYDLLLVKVEALLWFVLLETEHNAAWDEAWLYFVIAADSCITVPGSIFGLQGTLRWATCKGDYIAFLNNRRVTMHDQTHQPV